MSESKTASELSKARDEDGRADAYAATAVISIVVLGMYIWLSGMPT